MRKSRRYTASPYLDSDKSDGTTPEQSSAEEHTAKARQAFSRAPSLGDNQAALALEDIALSRDSNTRLDGLRNAADPRQDNSTFVTQRKDPHYIVIPGLESLPLQDLADYLLEHFLREYAWLYVGLIEGQELANQLTYISSSIRCFHAPTLERQWRHYSAHNGMQLNPLDIEHTLFLPTYCAIMCTTLYLMDKEDLTRIGFNEAQRATMTEAWSDLFEMALMKGDWGRHHRLETLQAFIIIGPYWSATGRSDTHYSMLGSAMKIAQCMGLHRLGPELAMDTETEQIQNQFSGKWKASLVQRETGRRVWWLLLELDLNASVEHDYLSFVETFAVTCAFPANVNDENIGEGSFRVMANARADKHTDMSYICSRLKFLQPLKRFISAVNMNNGHLTEEIMENTHEAYMSVVDALPPYYKTESPHIGHELSLETNAQDVARLAAESRAIKCNGYSALLRLHRLCLASALRSKKFAVCQEGAARGSRWLLEHDPTLYTLQGLPNRWWPFVHGVLTAAIVALLILIYTPRSQAKDLEILLRNGTHSLRRQKSAEIKSVAELLEGLLDTDMNKRAVDRQASGSRESTSPKRYVQDVEDGASRKFRRIIESALTREDKKYGTGLGQLDAPERFSNRTHCMPPPTYRPGLELEETPFSHQLGGFLEDPELDILEQLFLYPARHFTTDLPLTM
ncbi:hypothetical protein NliqN6_0139 [Naganishia liquefaciens]|uniref:Xylanolytic transcriptional activator regulatory domain-containing protein n=1 Tax=Naganishia liquefaciens TaxID=104408 RepID=A0A8H3TMF0_9TREE|nr:hypothetical protein NliqN6_0139 [Naganishia liquefaciens]